MKVQYHFARPIAILALSLISARADIVLVQDTENAITGKSRTTMSIKGSKVRTDVGSENSVIMDTETGDMTTLVHEQKMLVKMKLKDLPAAAPTGEAATPAKPVAPVKTGDSEKVDGYECDIYTLEVMGTKSKMWVARDYPGYAKLKKEMEVLAKMATGGAKVPELPGLAIKTVTEAGNVTYTTTLVSLKEKDVADSVFEVPSEYKPFGQ